ncbi:MAG: hypothetical protein WBF89_03850 [Steroidobacteraceae bacterium]
MTLSTSTITSASISTSNADLAQAAVADVLNPIAGAGATIGVVITPCSLGFVIIALSGQLIRSIMVGDDPVMLMSDLQNQFPSNDIEVDGNLDPELVAKVVELLDYLGRTLGLPLDSTCIKSFILGN